MKYNKEYKWILCLKKMDEKEVGYYEWLVEGIFSGKITKDNLSEFVEYREGRSALDVKRALSVGEFEGAWDPGWRSDCPARNLAEVVRIDTNISLEEYKGRLASLG